jgi:hypothetical protein
MQCGSSLQAWCVKQKKVFRLLVKYFPIKVEMKINRKIPPKNMIFLQEVDYDIWRNFHVDHFASIAIEFEGKFKHRTGLEI